MEEGKVGKQQVARQTQTWTQTQRNQRRVVPGDVRALDTLITANTTHLGDVSQQFMTGECRGRERGGGEGGMDGWKRKSGRQDGEIDEENRELQERRERGHLLVSEV